MSQNILEKRADGLACLITPSWPKVMKMSSLLSRSGHVAIPVSARVSSLYYRCINVALRGKQVARCWPSGHRLVSIASMRQMARHSLARNNAIHSARKRNTVGNLSILGDDAFLQTVVAYILNATPRMRTYTK